MSSLVDLHSVFLPRRQTTNVLTHALDYLRLAWLSWQLLQAERPVVLWLQLPPVPLLWVALLHRRLRQPDMVLVADCHNATFRPRWLRVPFSLSLLNRCDRVLVHNEAVAVQAQALGVHQQRLFVLEDVPMLDAQPQPPAAPPALLAGRPRPWVLFPGSFAADEPVGALLAAARRLPEVSFVMTGRRETAARHGHRLDDLPPNVLLPGYLDTADFDTLFRASDVVLALTREDGIQLSVCNEALGFGKAMVLSDTPLLRRLFAAAAVMVDSNNPDALAAAIGEALARRSTLEAAALAAGQARRQAWLARYAQLQAELARPLNGKRAAA